MSLLCSRPPQLTPIHVSMAPSSQVRYSCLRRFRHHDGWCPAKRLLARQIERCLAKRSEYNHCPFSFPTHYLFMHHLLVWQCSWMPRTASRHTCWSSDGSSHPLLDHQLITSQKRKANKPRIILLLLLLRVGSLERSCWMRCVLVLRSASSGPPYFKKQKQWASWVVPIKVKKGRSNEERPISRLGMNVSFTRCGNARPRLLLVFSFFNPSPRPPPPQTAR
jgi:hypothetical protein